MLVAFVEVAFVATRFETVPFVDTKFVIEPSVEVSVVTVPDAEDKFAIAPSVEVKTVIVPDVEFKLAIMPFVEDRSVNCALGAIKRPKSSRFVPVASTNKTFPRFDKPVTLREPPMVTASEAETFEEETLLKDD